MAKTIVHRPVHFMRAGRSHFTDDQIKTIRKDFKKQGIDLIVVVYKDKDGDHEIPRIESVSIPTEVEI